MQKIVKQEIPINTITLDKLPNLASESHSFIKNKVIVALSGKGVVEYVLQYEKDLGFIFRATDGSGYGHSGYSKTIHEAVRLAMESSDTGFILYDSFNELLLDKNVIRR